MQASVVRMEPRHNSLFEKHVRTEGMDVVGLVFDGSDAAEVPSCDEDVHVEVELLRTSGDIETANVDIREVEAGIPFREMDGSDDRIECP